MAPVKIYALIDPRTDAVRYVGKTYSPRIHDRLRVHIKQSRKAKKPTHKEAWVKQLLANGIRPVIRLLEVIAEGEDWASRERWWIATAAERGWNLTNLSIGGDSGFAGGKHLEENKRRQSERSKGKSWNKGRKWSDEERANHAASYDRSRERRAAAQRGKRHSLETRIKRALSIRGDNHGCAKVSSLAVVSIRERCAKGESRKKLAAEHGVSYSHLCRIAKGRAWSWL